MISAFWVIFVSRGRSVYYFIGKHKCVCPNQDDRRKKGDFSFLQNRDQKKALQVPVTEEFLPLHFKLSPFVSYGKRCLDLPHPFTEGSRSLLWFFTLGLQACSTTLLKAAHRNRIQVPIASEYPCCSQILFQLSCQGYNDLLV